MGQRSLATCRQFVILCRKLNLFSDAVVAIDGSKFKAVNTRDKNYTQAVIKRRMEQAEASIARYMAALDTADRQDPDVISAKSGRRKGSERRGKLCNMTNIKEPPEEIEGRLVPGHWEGDLILGTGGASAIGTLVERTSRFVVLVHMPTRKSDVVASAFSGALNAIPASLRKTLTYDQGKKWHSTRVWR